MEQIKEFLIPYETVLSGAIGSAITVLITVLRDHFVKKNQRYDEIDDEKFREVISPCMIKLEPILYKKYSIETIESIEEICNKKPHFVSVQVFQWLSEAKDYLSDKNENKSIKKIRLIACVSIFQMNTIGC
jgi:hypothetical protein